MSFKKRMDSLWTFEMMTLCLSHTKNEKCGFKKYEWTHCGFLK